MPRVRTPLSWTSVFIFMFGPLGSVHAQAPGVVDEVVNLQLKIREQKARIDVARWELSAGTVKPPADGTPVLRNLVSKELAAALAYLQAADSLPERFNPIVGSSATVEDARRRAAVVARHDVCVLLLGESGTGKELFAKAIHQASERRDGPYYAVNCAAIPGQLPESELFGHEKGAFTGADKAKDGLFTMADGGTLFLDEVGECDLGMQAKLLRVLQPPADAPCQRVFRRLSGKEDLVSDVRVIAATNRDLLDMVSKGMFREDLYYRLAAVTIRLPPLRERQSDIPEIASRLLQQIRHVLRPKTAKASLGLSADALRFVQTRRWKGNIRQLYNVMLQAAIFATGDEISRGDLEAASNDVGEAIETTGGFTFDSDTPVTEYLENMRKRLFREALRRSRENQSEAAKLLGVTPAAVSKFVRQQEAAANELRRPSGTGSQIRGSSNGDF